MRATKTQILTFDPYIELGLEGECRLVIYDEKGKNFFGLIVLNSKETYQLSETDLDSHLHYIYKYQIKDNNEWVDKTKYKSVRFEKLTDEGIKYLLYPVASSDYLIVGFQGISKEPGYNYVRTLKNIHATQLYIKDDYGMDQVTRSSFYLGPDRTFGIAENTLKLIEEQRINYGIDRKNVICIGSSKGGYASLYFAYKGGYGHVVVGGPQVRLGTYLSQGRKADNLNPKSFMPNILQYLVGNISDEKIKWADNILLDIIKDSNQDPSVFIHVGKGEPHYKLHVLPFIEFTNKLKLQNITIDLGEYDTHAELAKEFPPILQKKVLEITER